MFIILTVLFHPFTQVVTAASKEQLVEAAGKGNQQKQPVSPMDFLSDSLVCFRAFRTPLHRQDSSRTKWAGSGSSVAVGSSGSCGGTGLWF